MLMELEEYVRKRVLEYKIHRQYVELDRFYAFCEKRNIFLIDDGNGLENSKFFKLDHIFFKDYFMKYMYLYRDKAYYVWYKKIFNSKDNHNVNRKISKNKTKAIKKRDGYKCVMCGETHDLTIDHIFPWSIYHDNSYYNLITMCKECNENKADSILFSEKLQQLLINNNKFNYG